MKGLMLLLAVVAALSGSGVLLAGTGGARCPATTMAPVWTLAGPASDVGRAEAFTRGLWRQRLVDSGCP